MRGIDLLVTTPKLLVEYAEVCLGLSAHDFGLHRTHRVGTALEHG